MGPCAATKKKPSQNQPLQRAMKSSTRQQPLALPQSINYISLHELHKDGHNLSSLTKQIQSKLKSTPRILYLQLGNCFYLDRNYHHALACCIKGIQSKNPQIDTQEEQSILHQRYTGQIGSKQFKIGHFQNKVNQWYKQYLISCDYSQSLWDIIALIILQCEQDVQAFENTLKSIEEQQEYELCYQIKLILGHYYYNLSKYDQALKYYMKAKDIRENDEFILLSLGFCMLKLKNKEDSRNYYERALETNDTCAYAWFGLAKIETGTEKQKQYLEKAHQYNQSYARPFNTLGNIFSAKKQYYQAVYYYKKCIQINPFYSSSYFGIAQAFKMLKKPQQAIQNFQKCISMNSHDVQSYNCLGILYRNSKKYQQSIHNYEQCIKNNPNSQTAYNGLGNVHSMLKNYNQAIKCYKKCIQLNPTQLSQYNGLGNIYSELQMYQLALQYYNKALEINDKYYLAYNGMGIVYSNLDQSQNSINAYKKCIEINPKYQTAYNGLGNVYKKIKKYDEAIKYYNQALKVKEDYASPYNGLGDVYKQLKQFHKAVQCYEKCMENNGNLLFQLDLAMGYIEVENYGMAFQTFKSCESKLDGNHNLRASHVLFIRKSLENFKSEAQEWQYRKKIGFVSDQQKLRIKQMKQQFQKKYQQLFSSDSQQSKLSPEEVLNPRFMKLCQLLNTQEWDKEKVGEMASQIYQMFKQNHDSFQIMAQILCNYFWMKRFVSNENTSQIQVQLSETVKYLCAKFSPTEEREPILEPQFPSQPQIKINLFKETQFFSSYQGVVNEIQKINIKAKQIKPKFAQIVYDTQSQCNGLHCKMGLKLPDAPEKWFKVIIRIMEKMFKEIKNEKQNIFKEIEKKIDQEKSPSMLKIVKIIMQVWTRKIDQILLQRKKQKQPTYCYLTDLVRGKCLFEKPEQLKKASQFVIASCEKQNYKITQIDNRINKVTHDVVFKIQIDGIVCQFQLALNFDEDKFEYGHSFYEIDRSPLGCIFGSYLILSKGAQYSFFARVKDALQLLKKQDEQKQLEQQKSIKALEFIHALLQKSNSQK